METTVFSDIWTQLSGTIDFVLMLIIIACGYLVLRTNLLGGLFSNQRKTVKILILALPVTIIYSYLQEVEAGVAIASFFIAFGFHAIILKFIDRWVDKLKAKNAKP